MVPSYVTSPLTVVASVLADSICSSEMSPFTVSAETSPEIWLALIVSFTLLRSIRPRAFSSVTSPCTDLSETVPTPPETFTVPWTVSAVISPWLPSTEMSV